MESRHFQPGDGPAVRSIDQRAMRETPEYVPGGPDEDLHEVPGHYFEDGEFLVGVCGGSVVATAAYTPLGGWKREWCGPIDRPVRELTRVRVLPEYQRRGYGRALVRELERHANTEGVTELVLDTGADNAAARAFYESLGYDRDRTATVDFGGVELRLAVSQNGCQSDTVYRRDVPVIVSPVVVIVDKQRQ